MIALAGKLARKTRFHLENVDALGAVARFLFRLSGLYGRGRRNALDLHVTRIELPFQDLPDAFDGYSILHISDLHIDGQDELTEIVIDRVRSLSVDLAVLTGDYHLRFRGDFGQAIARTAQIIHAIRARDGVIGVRGNHDPPEMLPGLEAVGLSLLHNRAMRVKRGADEIWLVGLDDPHYYECDDIEAAMSYVPEGAFTILLVHSPEVVPEAVARGIRLYLCGHTHGGQVRLPRIGPVFFNARAPRRLGAGLWCENGMWGYTNLGAGSTAVPVRFGCDPEVAVITLRRGCTSAAQSR